MSRETLSKPLPRAFAVMAVALLAVCALAGVMNTDESEGYSTGTESNPLTSLNMTFDSLQSSDLGPYYVKVGSSVSISGAYDFDNYSGIAVHFESVTSGFGLTRTNGEKDGAFDGYLGLISGTISKAGTISISLTAIADNVEGILNGKYTMTIEAIADAVSVSSISISGSSSVTKGSSITLSASVSPSNATDKSVSWSVQSGSSYVSLSSNGTSCTVTGKAAGTATIKCTANDGSGKSATKTVTVSNPSYTCYLRYNANGGSGAPSTDSYTGTSTSSHYFTVSDSEPYRSGYTFLGWSTSSTASSASYTGGDSIAVSYNGSKTLYAVWQENKQYYYAYLYYNANGGSGAPSTQSDSIYASSASGSASFTIPSTKPTRSGYDFLGWSTSSGAASASYQPGSTISVSYDSSKTLYAVWKEKTYTSTLNFNANGGSGAPSSLTYTGTSTSAHKFTIPTTKPTRSGFVFLGWSDSSTSSTASYQPGSTISVPYNGTKTLYAVWQTAQLDITSEPATKSVKTGQSWSYTPTTNISGCTVTVSGADWLTVSDGKISGTPTTAGTYNVTVTVSKAGYDSDSQSFVLNVYSALGFNSVPGAHGLFAYAE